MRTRFRPVPDPVVSVVREYEIRTDEYSLARHRRLFETFGGPKTEYTSLPA